ncbi:protein-cysteine N-palmitoyltransferase HHAT-like [Antedon mediterranea]|uniref:protein-cysteine N-palmitoyltransferase HHAT-like n=1 Tax=Antedon mediterranea TaxID=105859 RepID=UPI003AF7551A
MPSRRYKKISESEADIQDASGVVSRKEDPSIARLPRLEILVYTVVAVICFICYPMYNVYKESQASAFRFYGVLADGYNLFGGLKDEGDFEWNFWRELVTVQAGVIVFVYIAVGRLAETFCPEWRNTLLLVLSLSSVTLLATWRCMLVLLLNAAFMYFASFSKRALVVWVAALLQLYSITNSFLIFYLNNFIENSFDYHLTIFCVALCNLRFLSFCLDYCSSKSEDTTKFSHKDFLLYVFYFPLFFFGPLMMYKDFHHQIEKKSEKLSSSQIGQVVKDLARYMLYIIFIEIVLHFLFFAAYHQRANILTGLPLWALAGNALCHLIFFQLKYQVMFGIPNAVAMLDRVDTFKPPVCIFSIYTFADMWRYFDRGLHSILLNYIYIPIGGSRCGTFRQLIGSLLCFIFVFYWHGLEEHIFYWALFNWVGVVIETIVNQVSKTEKAKSFKLNLSGASLRRVTAVFSVPGYIALSLANLLFLSGISMGYIYFERLIITSFPIGPLVLLLLYYCMIQLILECHRICGKKYFCEKKYY